jgi:hypothetical protein
MRTTSSQILSYTAKSGRPMDASVPFQARPAHEVMGWTDGQKAAWCIARDRNALAAAAANYAAACAALGQANRHQNKALRRINVAAAFRMINWARADMRAARKALTVSETAALQLALPFAT